MFYSTQEAVRFGLVADFFDRQLLSGLRDAFRSQFESAMDRDQFDLASVFGTQAQFCREALQAESIVADHPELFRDLV